MPIDEPTDKSEKPVNRPEVDEASLDWFTAPARVPQGAEPVAPDNAAGGLPPSQPPAGRAIPQSSQRSYIAPNPAAVVPGPLVQAPPAHVAPVQPSPMQPSPVQGNAPAAQAPIVEPHRAEAPPVSLPPATFEPFIAPQDAIEPQYIQPAPVTQADIAPVAPQPEQPVVAPQYSSDRYEQPPVLPTQPAQAVFQQPPAAPGREQSPVPPATHYPNPPELPISAPGPALDTYLQEAAQDPQIDAQLDIERGIGLRPTPAPRQQAPQSAQPVDPGYVRPPVRNDLLRGDAYEVPPAETTADFGDQAAASTKRAPEPGAGIGATMPPPGGGGPKFKLPKPSFAMSKTPWVRQLALIGGGIVGLIVLLVFVLPFFLPSQTIANEVSRQVKLATGWVLRIDGPISVGVFPTPRFSANDVSISADGENSVLRTDSIRFGINLAAIFTGNVRLDEVALVSPSIDLVVDEAGRATWEQASSSGAGDAGLRPSTGTAGETVVDDAGSALEALERLQIDEVTIRNGTVRYQDLRTTTEHVLSDIDVTTALTSLSVPLIIDSSFTYKDQSFELKTQLDDPGAAVDGARSPIEITLGGSVVNASLGGTVDFGLGPAFGGQFTSKIPSVTRLAEWLGTQLPENSKGLESIQASAELAASPTAVDISNFALSVGEETVQGALRADLTQADPFLSGELVSQGVDVATLLSAAGLIEEGQPSLDGSLIVDLQFATVGAGVEQMMSSLNARGTLGLRSGTISQTGLGLALGEADADTISNITANITINTLDTPIGLVGQADWRDEQFDMSGQFGAGQMLVNGMGPAQFAINSNRVSGGINGTFTQTGDFDGDVTLETRSLRGLMAWLNQPIGNGNGLGPFSYTGQLSLSPGAVNFDNARILVDGTTGTGSGTVTLSGKPKLKATLNLQQLDLTPYLASNGASSAAASQGGSNLPGVSGSSVNGGWSTDVIDLSGLKSVDADLNISAQEIMWDGIRTGRTAMAVSLTDGVLTADLTEMQLYEGRGAGRLEVNASGETPEIGINFDLSSLSAYPFLRDAAQFTRLEGAADFSIALKTRGRSELALVSGLDGETRMMFNNGAIRGINIPKMVRTLSARTLLGWQSNEQEKTDFSEFSGSFQFTNGLARTRDIRMVGPLVRATGAGSIDLPAKTLEMRFDPRVVASLQGQGGGQDLAGLGVPIVVEGAFSQPRIYPDIAGILENPDAAFQQLQRFGGGLTALTDDGDALRDQVRERTGVDLNQVVRDGRIDRDAAIGQGANLIGRLLGNQQGQSGGLAPVGGNNAGVDAPQAVAGGIPVPRTDPRGSFVRPTGPANAAPRFMTPAEARRATGGRAVVSGNGGGAPRAPAAAVAPAPANNGGPIDLLNPGSSGSGVRTTVQPGTGNPQGPASNPVEGLLRGIFGR